MIKQTITVEWDSMEEVEDEKDFEIVLNTWQGDDYFTESKGIKETLTEALEVANRYNDRYGIAEPVKELTHN